MNGQTHDVVIIGGGPAGSTAATLLRKYNPALRVVILEKAHFPRDHIGESQLPAISAILSEMGCWDAVEAANFPIKIGASFTWGRDAEPWDLDFYPPEDFIDEPRPARYEGQRRLTAFQVDRSIYDDILLRHAAASGADVREGAQVVRVNADGDRVTSLMLEDGEEVVGRYYLDASGSPAVLRRGLEIESDAPNELRNIAIWRYWQNAEWAFRIGVGGTRIFIRSLPYGWLWFIPLGPTRTSVGLVCPATWYRSRNQSPAEIYEAALASEPDMSRLLKHAQSEGDINTTRDWSHLAHRVAGENWFLIGEAAGFADPILSAGMTLAHGTAREAAYTILELDRGEIDSDWLLKRYDDRTRAGIDQHIRFAQYWYSSNGCFSDIQDCCQAIAKEAGVRLSPIQAWKWLAQGGFINHDVQAAQFGSFDVHSARGIVNRFTGSDQPLAIESANVYKLNLHGATKERVASLADGRMELAECWIKGGRRLPLSGAFGNMVQLLGHTDDASTLLKTLKQNVAMQFPPDAHVRIVKDHLEALETMIHEGWVIARRDRKRGSIHADRASNRQMRSTAEGLKAIDEAQRKRALSEE